MTNRDNDDIANSLHGLARGDHVEPELPEGSGTGQAHHLDAVAPSPAPPAPAPAPPPPATPSQAARIGIVVGIVDAAAPPRPAFCAAASPAPPRPPPPQKGVECPPRPEQDAPGGRPRRAVRGRVRKCCRRAAPPSTPARPQTSRRPETRRGHPADAAEVERPTCNR